MRERAVKLDKNGYAPSILMTFPGEECFSCFCGGDLARHEVFGAALRSRSKEWGLWVTVCPYCHERYHTDAQAANALKAFAQKEAMHRFGWDMNEWRRRFYKNYMTED